MKRVEMRPVMIVEDDVDVRDALFDLLVHEGYDVLVAENGKQALDYLRNGFGRG